MRQGGKKGRHREVQRRETRKSPGKRGSFYREVVEDRCERREPPKGIVSGAEIEGWIDLEGDKLAQIQGE